MKKVFAAAVLILGLTAAYAFAQMGHEMMKDAPAGHEHQMMEPHDMKDIKDEKPGNAGSEMEMEQFKMMNCVMDRTHLLSTMMQRMAGMMHEMGAMKGDISKEKINKMHKLMHSMSVEMEKVSTTVKNGSVTDEEMQATMLRMSELQKQMDEMK